ncbi:MAG: hypothetical protein GY835_24935 [bacterium]|nr:hypothetical protein [bacterium]
MDTSKVMEPYDGENRRMERMLYRLVLILLSIFLIVATSAVIVWITQDPTGQRKDTSESTTEGPSEQDALVPEEIDPPIPEPKPRSDIETKYSDEDIRRTGLQMEMVGRYVLNPLRFRLSEWIDRNMFDPQLLIAKDHFFSLRADVKDYQWTTASAKDREELGGFLTMADSARRSIYSMYLKYFPGKYSDGDVIYFGKVAFRVGKDIPSGMHAVQIIDRERLSSAKYMALIAVDHASLALWHERFPKSKKLCTSTGLPVQLHASASSFRRVEFSDDKTRGERELLRCTIKKEDAIIVIIGGHTDLYRLISRCAESRGIESGYYLWPERGDYNTGKDPQAWELKFLVCENFRHLSKSGLEFEDFLLLNTFRFTDFADPF